MQLRLIPAIAIYVGSYLPLSLILLSQDFDFSALHDQLCVPLRGQACRIPFGHPLAAGSFVLACLLCFITTLLVLNGTKPKRQIKILEAKHIPSDLMNYVLPYVVSFMSLDYKDLNKFVGFAVFLLWIFWITYKSGQIIMNPVLTAFGWKLYEIKYNHLGSDDCLTGLALTQMSIEPNRAYKFANIQEAIIAYDAEGPEQIN